MPSMSLRCWTCFCVFAMMVARDDIASVTATSSVSDSASPMEARRFPASALRMTTVHYPEAPNIPQQPQQQQQQQQKLYNPERGLYTQRTYSTSKRDTTLPPLSAEDLRHERNVHGVTIVLRLFYLDEFLDEDLSERVLEDVASDFRVLREAGFKAVIRFAYVDDIIRTTTTGTTAGAVVHEQPQPQQQHTEPSKAQLLRHISQLAPILTASQDVILSMQAGFIGPWGEWHSSSHFPTTTTASSSTSTSTSTSSNSNNNNNDNAWVEDLGDILKAILDAVPESIVQIRTPLLKKKIFDHWNYVRNGGMETTTTHHHNHDDDDDDDNDFVTNGSMEGLGTIDDWSEYMDGYRVSTSKFRSGHQSIVVTNGGAMQWVPLPDHHAPGGTIVTISGYSKVLRGTGSASTTTTTTTTTSSSDYSIYADVAYDDGTNLWGQAAPFLGTDGNNNNNNNDDWEHASHSFVVPEGKTVVGMTVYCMYRNQPSLPNNSSSSSSSVGVAYFDDVAVRVTKTAGGGGAGGGPRLSDALDASDAWTGSYKARTGHHNDCFLASDTDIGTYASNPLEDQQSEEYPYLSRDTKFTAMGGETCFPNLPRSGCNTALHEMQLFHYSYLSRGHHPDVLGHWATEGCFDEIVSRLGYKLVLRSGSFPPFGTPGGNLPFAIILQNDGFAAPVHSKRVQLVWKEATTGALCATTTTSSSSSSPSPSSMLKDARTWFAGEEHLLEGTAVLPQDMPPGTYRWYLNIADADETLKTRVDYKIKVANGGGGIGNNNDSTLNDPDTGFIDLQHTMTIVARNNNNDGIPSWPEASSGPMLVVSCNGNEVQSDILPESERRVEEDDEMMPFIAGIGVDQEEEEEVQEEEPSLEVLSNQDEEIEIEDPVSEDEMPPPAVMAEVGIDEEEPQQEQNNQEEEEEFSNQDEEVEIEDPVSEDEMPEMPHPAIFVEVGIDEEEQEQNNEEEEEEPSFEELYNEDEEVEIEDPVVEDEMPPPAVIVEIGIDEEEQEQQQEEEQNNEEEELSLEELSNQDEEVEIEDPVLEEHCDNYPDSFVYGADKTITCDILAAERLKIRQKLCNANPVVGDRCPGICKPNGICRCVDNPVAFPMSRNIFRTCDDFAADPKKLRKKCRRKKIAGNCPSLCDETCGA